MLFKVHIRSIKNSHKTIKFQTLSCFGTRAASNTEYWAFWWALFLYYLSCLMAPTVSCWWFYCLTWASGFIPLVSAGFTVCGSSLRAPLPQECVCVCLCIYTCVCQLERSWRTGAPLPRQHFLVINDFFLPLSLSRSFSVSVSHGCDGGNWWHVSVCFFSHTRTEWSSGRGSDLGERDRKHSYL